MKRIFIALSSILILTGCGEPVSVNPGYVAKLNTETGLQKGLIHPSKFRMEALCIHCDNLILLEASDQQVKETMKVFIPQDQLNITLDIRAVLAISADQETVNPIFARVAAQPLQKRISLISFQQVYNIYGQQVIRETTRAVLVKYSIGQIMENRDAVSGELQREISKRLTGTPLRVIRLGLADVQFPEIIVRAKERAAEREAAIAEAEAQKAIALKQQEIDLIEAETQVLVAQKLAEGVSPAFVTQRWLRVMETLAQNEQKTVFLLTPEAIGNPSIMMPTIAEGYKRR